MTSATLIFRREISTALARIHPRAEEFDRTAAPRTDEGTFQAKQDAYVYNFLGMPAWTPGKLVESFGCCSWQVQIASGTAWYYVDYIRQEIPGAFHEAECSRTAPPASLWYWCLMSNLGQRL